MTEQEYNEKNFFSSEEITEVKINGFVYGIKESNAKTENEMLKKIAKVDARTQEINIDVSASNEMKILSLLIKAPFKYKNNDGTFIEWEKCNERQKKELHDKMKPKLYSALVKEIDKINGSDKDF